MPVIKVGLMSDTHSHLHPLVQHHFADRDIVLHAGDIGTMELADAMEQFKPFRAVWGNIDGADLRARYKEDEFITLNGLTIYMTHIGGYPGKYNTRAKAILQRTRPGMFICGHSHILKVMFDPALQCLHINPGACGIYGWHKMQTLVNFEISEDGKPQNMSIIELPRKAS
jgi:putative phosphoesterase